MRKCLPWMLLLASACATTRPATWVPAEPTFVAPQAGYQLEVPAGLMRWDASEDRETFAATRDGTPLQSMVAGAAVVGKPLWAKLSKRPVTAGMSPTEQAELVIDNLRAQGDELQVVENAPAVLDGRPGFHVVVTMRMGGLLRRASIYGVQEGERLYWLTYQAPDRHYFARDAATFEALVRSFKLRAPAPVAPAPAPAA